MSLAPLINSNEVLFIAKLARLAGDQVNSHLSCTRRPTKLQRPDTRLEVGRFAIATFQFGQENRPFLFGSRFSHDLAAVQRVTLAGWFSGRAIRQQLIGGEWPRVRNVCIQCED